MPHATRLPPLRSDLVLLHAPAVFDFRDRSDIYFPYLSTSGDVPITPLYEYFPVGFKTLQRYLGERGHDVRIINLSTVLLRYPRIDIDGLLSALEAKVIGIDLHWMIHVQGSLEIARRIKAVNPHCRILFGGISSSYYADELIDYPFVDMVMRGYNTHEPTDKLLQHMAGGTQPRDVPNLLWKCDDEVVDNGFTYTPDHYGCGIDWTTIPGEIESQTLPILEIVSTQNAGCAYNCGWCGGSREAFRRVFQRKRSMARKTEAEVSFEFETMSRVGDLDKYHFYSVGSYNETKRGLGLFLDHVGNSRFKSISYEQYHLTSDDMLKKMAAANPRTTITLSPESNDHRIGTLAGRGVYTMQEMEAWIERALDYGIFGIDIWFFIGMKGQSASDVMADVAYSEKLLKKFRGKRVTPFVCPMIPFLDPASTFFEHPDEHGYRIFFRTAEQHRQGMTRASVINRINYETELLSRRDLVHVGYEAIRRLTVHKAENDMFPHGIAESLTAKIDDTVSFIDVVHEADSLTSEHDRRLALAGYGEEIRQRNREVFFAGVANQAFPINREIGGRWFDELGWTTCELEQANVAMALDGESIATNA